jgi:dihydroxyacetone kinase-like protein
MDAAFLRSWIEEMAASIKDQREYLTQLDAAIGDADHGTNMHRGFTAVVEKLAGADELTPGKVLLMTGSTLISTVGGASGPLYGTAFREAGKALGDAATSVGPPELASALEAALAGVRRLGAAQEGDKTMVDALGPAVDALAEGIHDGHDLATATTAARDAAEEGMRATIPMQARKGRASYLGPRSVGHQDPGATSTALMFAALERVASRVAP